jgi:hypothetical protein
VVSNDRNLQLQTVSHPPAQFSAIIVRAGSKTDAQGQTTTESTSLHFANRVTSAPNVITASGMSGIQISLNTYGSSAMHNSMV